MSDLSREAVEAMRSAMLDPMQCHSRELVNGAPYLEGQIPRHVRELLDAGLVELEWCEDEVPGLKAKVTIAGARRLAEFLAPFGTTGIVRDGRRVSAHERRRCVYCGRAEPTYVFDPHCPRPQGSHVYCNFAELEGEKEPAPE
jgi:hypothetical protein